MEKHDEEEFPSYNDNDNKKNISAILAGVFANSAIIISSIFLSFKSGISSTIDTAALVLLILILFRKYSLKNAVIAEVIARGSITSARDTATLVAVIIIFGGNLSIPNIFKIILIILVSSIIGTLFFSGFYERFEDQSKYSFPMVKPRVDLFKTLNKNTRNKGLLVSLSATSIYSFFVNIVKILPQSIKLFYIFSMENNPMLIATGYIIGYKTYLIMGFGFIYSLITYIIFNDNGFVAHLMNPYMFSVVTSFVITQGLISIYGFISKSIKKINLKDVKRTFFTKNSKFLDGYLTSSNMAIYIVFLIFNMLFFTKTINPGYSMPFWIFLILLPLTIILTFSTMFGVAQTGFWFSVLEDVLPILIILLTFTKNISAVVLVICSMEVFEISGIYFIVNTKFSSDFGISKKDNIRLNILSNINGALLCIFIVLVFSKTFGLGTEQLPIPFANTLGMTIKGLIESLSSNILPGYINIYVIICSAILCIILNKLDLSPIIIIGGMMLPFNIYITMSIGALISYILRADNAKYRPIFSGIATADGLISSLSAIITILR